jgi:hypothetical protein
MSSDQAKRNIEIVIRGCLVGAKNIGCITEDCNRADHDYATPNRIASIPKECRKRQEHSCGCDKFPRDRFALALFFFFWPQTSHCGLNNIRYEKFLKMTGDVGVCA